MGRFSRACVANSAFPHPSWRDGPAKEKDLNERQLGKNASGRLPVSLGQWSSWWDVAQKTMVGKLIGCSVSNSTKYNYTGHFGKGAIYRPPNGHGPYLGGGWVDLEKDGHRWLSYSALAVGPITKDMTTMITRMRGIGHFQKLKWGPNPIRNMPLVQPAMRGMRREKGPTARKPPFAADDIRSSKNLLDENSGGHQVVRRDTIMGRFSALRISEILSPPTTNMSEERYRLHMGDIAPISKGVRTYWVAMSMQGVFTSMGRKLNGGIQDV